MVKQQIDSYREKIDIQLKEKENEIENSITYISVGALGFFLTINEKFFKIDKTNCSFLLYTSLSLLLLSFIIILIKKYKTTSYDRKIIDFLDELPENNKDKDKELLKLWKSCECYLKLFKISSYSALGLGITLQLVFFFSNLLSPLEIKNSNEQKFQIEIKHDDRVDTLIYHLK